MKRLSLATVCGVMILGLVGTAQASIVDINAVIHSDSNPLILSFEAGTYDVVPIKIEDGGAYTAWSTRYGIPGSWVHNYCVNSDAFDAICFLDCPNPQYNSADEAFDNCAESTSFTVGATTDVAFYVLDYPNAYYDNEGGISLEVSDGQGGWSGTANAEASVYGGNSLAASGSFNSLALLLAPIGAVIGLMVWRRKR